MYQLLAYLSCSLLLVAAVTELPDELSLGDSTTDLSIELPVPSNCEDLEPEEPDVQDDDLMAAHKINWLIHAQGQNKDPIRSARQVRNVEEAHDVATKQASSTEAVSNTTVTTKQPVQAAQEEDKQEVPAIRDGKSCSSSAENGLTRLIRDARSLLPVERLRNILVNAREDAEVRELIKLLLSDQFRERVMLLRSTKELSSLRNYLCDKLKLDHAYYIDYVRVFLNLHATAPPSTILLKPRKGIRGLLQDLREALPRGQLRDLYRRQVLKDKELVTAVRRIRSSEFRRLLSSVRSLPEYRAISIELEKSGVPLQQVLNLVSNALGWGAVDMGSEIDIILV